MFFNQLNSVQSFCATIFHAQVLVRTNYWADFLEILHGRLFKDFRWDSQGTFVIFDLEPLIWGDYWKLGGPQGVPHTMGSSSKIKKVLRLSHLKSPIRHPYKISKKSAKWFVLASTRVENGCASYNASQPVLEVAYNSERHSLAKRWVFPFIINKKQLWIFFDQY